MPAALKLTLIGGPTAILEYAGLRWLTDPTFSPPGEHDDLSSDPTQLAPMIEVLQAKRATLKEIHVKADAPAESTP